MIAIISHYEIPSTEISSLKIFSQFEKVFIFANFPCDVNFFEQFSNVTLIQNNRNLGISAPINSIVNTLFDDDIVIILDQDTYFDVQILDTLNRKVCANPNVVYAPATLEPSGNLQSKWAITSGMVGQAKIFREILFDQNIPLDYADIDFCFRAENAGYLIEFVPNYKIVHRIGNSSTNDKILGRLTPTNHPLVRYKNMLYACVRMLKKRNLTLKQKYIIVRHTLIVIFVAIFFDEKKHAKHS